MTELVASDVHRPARVILLTLVSFRGVGSSGETPGRFRVDSRFPEVTAQKPASRVNLANPIHCPEFRPLRVRRRHEVAPRPGPILPYLPSICS